MAQQVILIFHVLLALSIIGLVLIQHGKGAQAGAAFGSGASQTVFGSQGAGSFLTRLTTLLAFLFALTSILLSLVAKNSSSPVTIMDRLEEQGLPINTFSQPLDQPLEQPAENSDEIPEFP